MPSFNRVIIAGNLTRDPELSYTPGGVPICKLGLAINRKWRNKDGQEQEEVCFVDLVAFQKTAEVINQYLTKGSPALFEGRLKYESWQDKNGNNRSKLLVQVDQVTFLGSRENREGGGQTGQQGRGRNQGQTRGGPAAPGEESQGPGPQDDGGEYLPNGDRIPF